jgi:hypothetical protein
MAKRDWRTSPDRPGRVTIRRPDPETGEEVKVERAQSTIKATARKARTVGDDGPPNLLGITAEERRGIIAGSVVELYREEELEGVEKGYTYVVAWDRPKSFADPETKTILTPDASPSCWVTVSGIVLPKGKGHRTYKLRVEHHGRMVPAYLLKRKAGYTVNRDDAIDEQAAVLSEKDLNRIGAESRQVQADRRELDAKRARQAGDRQLKLLNETLKEAQAKLSPLAFQLLLARVESDLREALSEGAEAA